MNVKLRKEKAGYIMTRAKRLTIGLLFTVRSVSIQNIVECSSATINIQDDLKHVHVHLSVH